jgi:predicted nucleic acid-binding protein
VRDAAYLELAQRHPLPLATLDEELCAAAWTRAFTISRFYWLEEKA